MKRFLVATAVVASALSLTSCTQDSSAISTQSDSAPVAQFDATTAQESFDNIIATLHNPQSTEDDMAQLATSSYIASLNDEYGGSGYTDARDVAIERDKYWESDEIVSDTVGDVIASDIAATVYRDRVLNVSTYTEAPEEKSCTITEQWVNDSGQWKLDSAYTSDCDGQLASF